MAPMLGVTMAPRSRIGQDRLVNASGGANRASCKDIFLVPCACCLKRFSDLIDALSSFVGLVAGYCIGRSPRLWKNLTPAGPAGSGTSARG